MRREGGSARGRRLLTALLLLAAVAIAPLGRTANAGAAPGRERMGPAVEEGSAPGDETNRWWGVAGAALCGLEIRLIVRVPAVGMNPYALAAGIAGCGLAALDLFTTQ